ncbi:MAG TPA: ATP synthase subunit I, partial [Gammaproteobacteria bacterium]|nr:ATP synthase subunit I [Gammaproteobacteria bacterium]
MKKNRPHNEAWWALVIQGVSLILLTPIVWFVKDEFVAGSMLLGGLACLIPNVCLYANVFRYFGAQHAHKMVRALYFGELVKLFLTAGIFAFLA